MGPSGWLGGCAFTVKVLEGKKEGRGGRRRLGKRRRIWALAPFLLLLSVFFIGVRCWKRGGKRRACPTRTRPTGKKKSANPIQSHRSFGRRFDIRLDWRPVLSPPPNKIPPSVLPPRPDLFTTRAARLLAYLLFFTCRFRTSLLATSFFFPPSF